MVHFHLRNGDLPTDRITRWCAIAIMVGFVLVELAACTWIIYKIISPKY